MTRELLFVFMLVAALGGFAIAARVWRKKTRKETLVCPIGSNCDAVINSSYSVVFGVPVEVAGMLYYGCIALASLAFLFFPSLAGAAHAPLLWIALLAEAFSVYLLGVQAVLKEWCLWCIGSFAASTLVFILAVLL